MAVALMDLIDGVLLSVSQNLEAHFLLSPQVAGTGSTGQLGQAFPALVHLTPDGVINLPSLETAGSQLSRVAGVSASPDLCDSRVGDRRCAGSSFALWEDLCEAMCIRGGQGVQEGGQGLSLPRTISQTWA